jgi:hypothetical protein
MEYSVKNRRHRPRLIATEVKRAERIILEIKIETTSLSLIMVIWL